MIPELVLSGWNRGEEAIGNEGGAGRAERREMRGVVCFGKRKDEIQEEVHPGPERRAEFSQ